MAQLVYSRRADTCPARPWETFPPKEGAEELRCLLFFHLCSQRSPLLQQRTHECKGKGGRGDASPSLLKLRGRSKFPSIGRVRSKDCACTADACCIPSNRKEDKSHFMPPPSGDAEGKMKHNIIIFLVERTRVAEGKPGIRPLLKITH